MPTEAHDVEISVSLVVIGILKTFLLLACAGLTYMFICWPINDQPTSKTQHIIWAIVVSFIATNIFTNLITWSA